MSENKERVDRAGPPHHLTTVTLTADQFESLYLQPRSSAGTRNALVGNLGNPAPLGISSLILSLFPLSMDLMQFQGASVASAATLLGGFYAVGGIGLYLSCIMEWIIGNTFPSIVFGVLGGFFISYAIILQPSFEVAASFASVSQATSDAAAAAAGSSTKGYNSGIGLYFLVWGLLLFVLFVAALRTNVPFAGVFFFLTISFELIAAAYFHIGHGHVFRALNELKAAGAMAFIVSILAIWIDVSLVFASVGFPFKIPVIDLSGRKDDINAAGEQV